MSSEFSLKTVIFVSSGFITGVGTPSKYLIGRWHKKRSNFCLNATFRDLIPPPIGVVRGPFIPTENSFKASMVSCGSHSSSP